MNIQSVIPQCALGFLLSFQPTTYAEISLNASDLNDNMSQNKGIQLHLLNEGLGDNLHRDTDLAIETQTLNQGEYVYRVANIDHRQLAAIYDNYINTKLMDATGLKFIVSTNLQTSQYNQKHVADTNLSIENVRESSSTNIAIMIDDD